MAYEQFDILVKPRFDGGGGGVVVGQQGIYKVYSPNGELLDTISTSGVRRGNHGYKVASRAIASGLPEGSYIEFNGVKYTLKGNGARNEFKYGNSTPTLVGSQGAVGGVGMGANGVPTSSGQVSGGVAYPYDISGAYPDPVTIGYNPTTLAPYQHTDPIEYAERFAEFNREQQKINWETSREMAEDVLDTELEGLRRFAPEAARIQRDLVSADNRFNQRERTAQLEAVIPDVLEDQDAQAERARSYARGELPDEVQDAALSLGVRSSAADIAAAGGFGPQSSASRSLATLMSADKRFDIARFGEELSAQSMQGRAQLRLAPTEYANAGSQIKVTPTRDAGSVSEGLYKDTNQNTLLRPSEALGSETQQQQFRTTQEQGVNNFNATNRHTVDTWNATTRNQFALGLFDYQAQLANNIQQSNQAQQNIIREDALREQNIKTFEESLRQAQRSGDTAAVGAAIGGIISAFGGVSGLMNAIEKTVGSDLNGDGSIGGGAKTGEGTPGTDTGGTTGGVGTGGTIGGTGSGTSGGTGGGAVGVDVGNGSSMPSPSTPSNGGNSHNEDVTVDVGTGGEPDVRDELDTPATFDPPETGEMDPDDTFVIGSTDDGYGDFDDNFAVGSTEGESYSALRSYAEKKEYGKLNQVFFNQKLSPRDYSMLVNFWDDYYGV